MAERKRKSATKKEPNLTYAEKVAQTMIEQIEAGTAPWVRPWQPGTIPPVPFNAATGKPYRGSNSMWLSMLAPTSDPRWCTYKQAEAMGAQVMKGSHGTLIQYWKTSDRKLLKDEDGKPVVDEEGRKKYVVSELERPRPFTALVFHASQIEGLPPLPEQAPAPEWERHAAADRIMLASQANIHHGEYNQAYYKPSTDSIHLPDEGQFASPDLYYATVLHELGHWTGHESRLNRDLSGVRGSESYAREELRAEMASFMLGQELGLGHDPSRHASYLASWVRILQDDPKEILRAATDAQRIMDFLQEMEMKARVVDEMDATTMNEGLSVRDAPEPVPAAQPEAPVKPEAPTETVPTARKPESDDVPERVYPFGTVEANDLDESRFAGSRVRVAPQLRGEEAWEGEVARALNGGYLIEVRPDSHPESAFRIDGDRIEVLSVVDAKAPVVPEPDPMPEVESVPAQPAPRDDIDDFFSNIRPLGGNRPTL